MEAKTKQTLVGGIVKKRNQPDNEEQPEVTFGESLIGKQNITMARKCNNVSLDLEIDPIPLPLPLTHIEYYARSLSGYPEDSSLSEEIFPNIDINKLCLIIWLFFTWLCSTLSRVTKIQVCMKAKTWIC